MRDVDRKSIGKDLVKSDKMRQIAPYIMLALLCFLFCGIFVLQYGVFGAKIDWINQHSVLPDYFRKRFYETGNFLPDFAWNIGGGQNIYHLSYYGLLSPVILLSFLFPFIRMDYFIMGSSILCYIFSVLLFYYFLEKKEESRCICFGTTIFFALASPLIYQFYNQLMFVNYMPFLCLAMIGTDDYLKKQKNVWLLCGVTGMILTSFYFSIGGMLALCLYAVSEYLHETDRVDFFPLLKKGVGYVGVLLHGILLCGILLVPTAFSVLSSRQENVSKEKITELFSFAPLKILYNPYGMGLSVLAIVAVLGGIFCISRWQEIILPLGLTIILAVPAIGFLLNGGLYDKQKVFIPLIPLVCLQCARYVKNLNKKRYMKFFPWFLTGLLLFLAKDVSDFKDYQMLAWVDFCVTLFCFLLAVFLPAVIQKARKSKRLVLEEWDEGMQTKDTCFYPLVLLSSCLCLFLFDMMMHPERDRMISREEYQTVVDSSKIELIKKVLREDTSYYRMEEVSDGTTNHNNVNRIADIRQNITSMYSSCYNKEYWNFRNNTYALNEPFRNNMMQSVTDNPCFLQLMGVKYLLSEKEVAGYESVKNMQVLKNSSVAPILYVTNQIMGEEQYKKYSFPTNQTALLYNAVVPEEAADVEWKLPQMSECSFELPEYNTSELTITEISDGYKISAKEEVEIQVKLSEVSNSQESNLFALIFDVENKRPNSDMYIRVNEQTNRLTAVSHEYANHNTNFTFMTTKDRNSKMISIKFGAGNYKINNLKAYTGELEKLQNPRLYQNTVTIDTQEKSGRQLMGEVKADESGYLITSIPYDENFFIYLDGEEIEKRKVNTSFLGAKIPAGKHTLLIVYRAPGKRIGCLLSLAGVIIIIALKLKNTKEDEFEFY